MRGMGRLASRRVLVGTGSVCAVTLGMGSCMASGMQHDVVRAVAPGMRLYVNGTDGYSMRYPATWQLVLKSSTKALWASAVLSAPDKMGEVEMYAAVPRDNETAAWGWMDAAFQLHGTVVGSASHVVRMIHGVPFRIDTATISAEGPERIFRLYEAVSGSRAYSFASQVPIDGSQPDTESRAIEGMIEGIIVPPARPSSRGSAVALPRAALPAACTAQFFVNDPVQHARCNGLALSN